MNQTGSGSRGLYISTEKIHTEKNQLNIGLKTVSGGVKCFKNQAGVRDEGRRGYGLRGFRVARKSFNRDLTEVGKGTRDCQGRKHSRCRKLQT